MSDKSTNQQSSRMAAAAPQPARASAPKERHAGGKPPVKEPQTDQGKVKVSDPKHADGKK
jgi:hypothetical protein